MNAPFPWQENAWQLLQTYLKTDRLPHALLFSGIAGLGKSLCAKRYSQQLLCEQATGCGVCASCRLFQAGTHPDFYLLSPTGDKIRSLKVSAVREIIEATWQTPMMSRRQVIVIERAELMNRAASNALLKTLEEPSGDVILLLVSDQSSRLLATVRSRCQVIRFQVPTKAVANVWLSRQGILDNETTLRLNLASGAPILAASDEMTKQLQFRDRLTTSLFELLSSKQTMVSVAADLAGQDLFLLSVLYHLIADVVRDHALGQQKAVSMKLLGYHPVSFWFEWLGKIQQKQRLVESNIALNLTLLWEDLLGDL